MKESLIIAAVIGTLAAGAIAGQPQGRGLFDFNRLIFNVDPAGPEKTDFDGARSRLVAVSFGFTALPAATASAAGEKSLQQVCDEEFRELADQIRRERIAQKDWQQRLAVESLDCQALIWPQDRDPLDVVLRRTAALLEHCKQRQWVPLVRQAAWDAEMAELRAAQAAESADDARRAVFDRVCQLRRQVAMANPLLDFDAIVCMLEQPGNARIIEQARAVWPGHSRGGGGCICSGILTFLRKRERMTLVAAQERIASTGRKTPLAVNC